MYKRSLLIVAILTTAACSPLDTSRPVTEDEGNSSATAEQAVPMHQSGYLLHMETRSGWSIKQNNDGPIIDLSLSHLHTCVKEKAGTPCTAADLLEGMQLDILGFGYPDGNYPTMDVTSVRVIGTSLTFHKVGDLSSKPDGVLRMVFTQNGRQEKMRVSINKKTICAFDGETKPCTISNLEGGHGSLSGEIREKENAIRATWINLP